MSENKIHPNECNTYLSPRLLAVYPKIKAIYEKNRKKQAKKRYVDFNQGTDCRYVTEDIMRIISEIPIRPLRIAFDYLSLRPKYENAVRLAAKYGIKELSNYILYNFVDKPSDLYERLKVNVDLSLELDLHIYSFPMKYIPLFGEEAKHRKFIGKHWNAKFIRAIQSILNVTRGIVAPIGKNEKAFGRNLEEYFEILYMPKVYIVYRKIFEDLGYTEAWKESFRNLNDARKQEAKKIIEQNDFKNITLKTNNRKIQELLVHYTINKRDVEEGDKEFNQLKRKFKQLINQDQFMDLTLTYDFDREVPLKPRATLF